MFSCHNNHEVGTDNLTDEKIEAQGQMEKYDIIQYIQKSGITQRMDWLAEEVIFSKGTTGLSVKNNVFHKVAYTLRSTLYRHTVGILLLKLLQVYDEAHLCKIHHLLY